jgi:hypothetical protein|tara:strand:- start:1460 stop:1951 length:492 start_codon:yes stop_codon:yes gene_type:complete
MAEGQPDATSMATSLRSHGARLVNTFWGRKKDTFAFLATKAGGFVDKEGGGHNSGGHNSGGHNSGGHNSSGLVEGEELYLVFRGSCSGMNVLTDLDYRPCDKAALASFAAESGISLPDDLMLHRGFLSAWRSLRQVLASLTTPFFKSHNPSFFLMCQNPLVPH